MKLIRFSHDGAVHAGVVTDRGIAPVTEINARTGGHAPDDLLEIIRQDASGHLLTAGVETLPFDTVRPLAPFPAPPKITPSVETRPPLNVAIARSGCDFFNRSAAFKSSATKTLPSS